MRLSEVEFKDITRGMRVQSSTNGTKGRVSSKEAYTELEGGISNIVYIDWETWDNGYSLRIKHHLCSRIKIV